MPYNREHMLLQWGGSFSQGGNNPVMDQFAGTIRFAGPGVAQADTDEVGVAMRDALQAWWFSANNFIPNIALLGWIKWNRIGLDGRYASSSRTRIEYVNPQLGGATSTRYPLQVAWTSSWGTDLERGRGSKGRTYWPTAVGVTTGTNGRVAANDCTTMASACANLILSLNTAAQSGGGTVVAMVMSDLGSGTSAPITRVRVGNRLDIQRRRDNDVEEEYQTLAIATEPTVEPIVG